ncbi:aminotransferase class I/II-fold pyridoxal phosphate-dependent enzyme [bacterium]|nr:aminotransferase class I/II-fold pyridoxal phosphate-dependent enzyme [bacterium]
MNSINPQAEELNNIIHNGHPTIESQLSKRGKAIFFPKKGLLSQAAAAKGKSINATVGIALADDGNPMRLPAIAQRIDLDPKKIFPYASSYGIPQLREAWARQIFKKNPSLKAEISLPVVTNGLTHGLSMTAYLFMDQGDSVILPDVYWGNYRLVMRQNYGVQFKTYQLFKDNGYNVDGLQEQLEATPGKQIILLNFPNNPTGYSLTISEADQITNHILKSAEQGNKITVIMDDAYFGLVYENGVQTESMFAKLADLHENILAIKVDGATKEDYAWGFRVGFLTYASKGASKEVLKALEDKTGGAIRSNISSSCHLSQSLILEALNSDDYENDKAEKAAIMESRYNKVKEILAELGEKYKSVFTALPFNSGYFMCLKLHEDLDAETIRKTLLEKKDIGVIATDGLIRVAFSSVPVTRLKEIFEAVYEVA